MQNDNNRIISNQLNGDHAEKQTCHDFMQRPNTNDFCVYIIAYTCSFLLKVSIHPKRTSDTDGCNSRETLPVCGTVDGSELRRSAVEVKVVYPIIYREFIHPGC